MSAKSNLFKVKLNAEKYEYAKSSGTCIVELSACMNKDVALGIINEAYGLRGAHCVDQLVRASLHREEIHLDNPEIKTVADMGISANDYLLVKFGGRYQKRSSHDDTIEKMRLMDQLSKQLDKAKAQEKKRKTQKNTKTSVAFRGTGRALNSGEEVKGKPLPPARGKKVVMKGVGYRLNDGKITGKSIEKKLVQDLCADNARKNAVNSDVDTFMEEFGKGKFTDLCRADVEMRALLDDHRSILTCLTSGDYAINKGASDFHILGKDDDNDDDEWDKVGVFTVKYKPRVGGLFTNSKEAAIPMVLSIDKESTINAFTQMHARAKESGDWDFLQPNNLLTEHPNAFWSLVYVANISKGASTSVVGKSWDAKVQDMLSHLMPELDWSCVQHGETDGDRIIVPSMKAIESIKNMEAQKTVDLGSEPESEDDGSEDEDYK